MAAPLADRARPTDLNDVVGQKHLLGEGRVLRRIIDSGHIPNMIFYGPSGTGKTTLAGIIAARTNMRLHTLNATSASIQDVKDVIGEVGTFAGTNGILLYLDEIQYFNKKQQQTLLETIEKGSVTLVAATTENPYFYVYNAILSRSTVFEFKPVERDDLIPAVERGFRIMEQEHHVCYRIDSDVPALIANVCGGDVRKALNTVELCCLAAQPLPEADPPAASVTPETVAELSGRSALRLDRDADEHYDILSAFHKSVRGSDPDAALHYLARLLEGGDLVSPCRRLLAIASEDIGLAYPMAVVIVKACVDSANQLGLPEAMLPLSQAVVLLATAPKSNSASAAIGEAMEDVRRGNTGDIPDHLRDAHYGGAAKLGHGVSYQFPHNFPNHWIQQQYLPDRLLGKQYYQYGPNKTEQAARAYWDAVKSTNPEKVE